MGQFDEWRQAATRTRKTGSLCLDGEAQAQLHDAIVALNSAQQLADGMLEGPDEIEALAEEVKRLDAVVQDHTRTFVFERIAGGRWREIEQRHPATEQQKEANPRQTVNRDAFEPVIVAECCVEPTMTVDDAQWLKDFVPDDVWEREVLGPVMVANKIGIATPKGVSAIADSLITALRSTTPPLEESPLPSSEDV